MRNYNISTKYKIWYAIGFILTYTCWLIIYSFSIKDNDSLCEFAIGCSVFYIFMYYFFIQRMFITITNSNKLIYRTSNIIFKQTVNIKDIQYITFKNRFFGKEVIIHTNNNTIKLYPQKSSEFMLYIESQIK